MLDNNIRLYPLAVVASELDCGTRYLEQRCNGAIVRNEDGMRCVPGDLVRKLIAEQQAKAEARREVQRRDLAEAEAARGANPVRERVRAIRSRQERETAFDTNDDDMAVSALARVTAEETAAKAETAGQRFSEMARGGMTYHPLRNER
jgi:hypothetical protein